MVCRKSYENTVQKKKKIINTIVIFGRNEGPRKTTQCNARKYCYPEKLGICLRKHKDILNLTKYLKKSECHLIPNLSHSKVLVFLTMTIVAFYILFISLCNKTISF